MEKGTNTDLHGRALYPSTSPPSKRDPRTSNAQHCVLVLMDMFSPDASFLLRLVPQTRPEHMLFVSSCVRCAHTNKAARASTSAFASCMSDCR